MDEVGGVGGSYLWCALALRRLNKIPCVIDLFYYREYKGQYRGYYWWYNWRSRCTDHCYSHFETSIAREQEKERRLVCIQ